MNDIIDTIGLPGGQAERVPGELRGPDPEDEGGLEKVIDWKIIDDDGLPPAGIPLLVTVDRGNTGGPRRVVIGPVYYMKTSFSGQWRFCEHGNEEHTIGPEFIVVTAWSEWPAPYTGGSK